MSLEIANDYSNWAETEIPQSVRLALISAISQAYHYTYNHHKDTPWLNWDIGKDLIGHIRKVVVEFCIMKAIDNKELPLTYRIKSNSIKNNHHLELLTKNNSVITLSQVGTQAALPRPANFRTENSLLGYRFTSQYSFNFGHDNEIVTPKNVIITHGYGGDSPKFITLSMPSPYVKTWLLNVNMLLRPIEVTLPESEIISEDFDLELQEYLKRMLPGAK